MVHIRPGEDCLRIDLWKRGGFRGQEMWVGRIPVKQDRLTDEAVIGGLVSFGLIEDKNWIPIRDGDKLSIVDVDTDFEEYILNFESKMEDIQSIE